MHRLVIDRDIEGQEEKNFRTHNGWIRVIP